MSLMFQFTVTPCALQSGPIAFENIGQGNVQLGSHPVCVRMNTGIKPNSLNNLISESPNPILYGMVKIAAPGELQVDLFDRTGRLVQHSSGTDMIFLSVDDYPSGLYFALIRTENEVVRKKILKN